MLLAVIVAGAIALISIWVVRDGPEDELDQRLVVATLNVQAARVENQRLFVTVITGPRGGPGCNYDLRAIGRTEADVVVVTVLLLQSESEIHAGARRVEASGQSLECGGDIGFEREVEVEFDGVAPDVGDAVDIIDVSQLVRVPVQQVT